MGISSGILHGDRFGAGGGDTISHPIPIHMRGISSLPILVPIPVKNLHPRPHDGDSPYGSRDPLPIAIPKLRIVSLSLVLRMEGLTGIKIKNSVFSSARMRLVWAIVRNSSFLILSFKKNINKWQFQSTSPYKPDSKKVFSIQTWI